MSEKLNNDNSEMHRVAKNSNILITWVLRGIIIVTLILAVVMSVWSAFQNSSSDNNYFVNAFTLLVLLVITFIPEFVNNKKLIIIPAALETGILIFTFLAMYLGEVFRFYDKFWWWDVMLHSLSAFMLGLIGFLLFFSLNRDNNFVFKLNGFCIMLFAFFFAVTCGVFWEVFEFAGDSLFGMNMQKSVYITESAEFSANSLHYVMPDEYMEQYVSKFDRVMDPGLVDTMKDIIVDIIGAFVAVIVGYLISKFGHKSSLDFGYAANAMMKHQSGEVSDGNLKDTENN